MLRGSFQPDKLTGERYFRWRGGDVSRIEGLCDAVFALALTLLVVRLDVPRSMGEVMYSLERAPVYLACFSFFVWVWYSHYQFHRRYGLEGPLTVALDGAIVFVVLLFALPLRFFADLSYSLVRFGDTWQRGPDGTLLVGPDGAALPMIEVPDRLGIMAYYAIGFILIFGLFAWQTHRAWRLRRELELDEVEELITRNTRRAHLGSALVGVLALLVALFGGSLSSAAGLIFILMGPLQGTLGWWHGRRVTRLAEKDPEALAP